MGTTSFWALYGEAAKTSLGFFWKSGWAFVLGYAISGMIQAFVPKRQLTRHMGEANLRSVALATGFGAISSSCSFAALAAARSLLVKGAHFVATVAFMFASTNLVMELGILIWIFLGWQFLVAEVIGGLVLIAISSLLMRLIYPRELLQRARETAGETAPQEEDFDWRERIRSREGWQRVGNGFVQEWKMAWEDIFIGFIVAGFVAVFVPTSFWEALFLVDVEGIPGWLLALENAVVAPFVAAATFIGSMGNIPLATVLNANGVVFAGIMGFIYSDLMVPPLVRVNAKYYGWRTALYIAGIMFLSIVSTALILTGLFTLLSLIPEGHGRAVQEITRFGIDYTFWLNLVFAGLALFLVFLHRQLTRREDGGPGDHHDHGDEESSIKRWVVGTFVVILMGGMVAWLVTGGTS
jgi:uncharacterized membrane protein YraQ (UPF0718 family)